MENFAISILLFINSFLGISEYPKDFKDNWKIIEDWQQDGIGYVLHAESSILIESCKNNPKYFIEFPRIVHSAHKILIDGKEIFQMGDFTFKKSSPFYEQPIINCQKLISGKSIEWIVSSYSKYFARFSTSPKIVENPNVRNFFNTDANIIATGVLLVLSLFSSLIFFGRVPLSLALSVVAGGTTLAGYFLNVANARFGIDTSMLVSHKLADLSLWVGISFFFFAFYIDKVVKRWMMLFLLSTVCISIFIISFGKTGNQIQLGTILPMLPYSIISCYASILLFKNWIKNKKDKNNLTRLLSLGLFFTLGNVDVLNIFGVIDSVLLLSVGISGAVFGLAVAVNQDIDKTYQERDSLLVVLEQKVAEKTIHLTEAMTNLKSAQAELVQSAKLASLGTLSAGVAHEINNAINFVNGAIIPLERKVTKYIPAEESVIVGKLFEAIKQGTSLTVEIVKSLRNFTGLNQSKVKDVSVLEVVNSVLTILKSKTKNIKINLNIDPTLSLTCFQVGLNQVIMNILSNAIDVLPEVGGQISISAESMQVAKNSSSSMAEYVEIKIKDNGTGMKPEVKDRIFDPFFTTKEVGKGTGLGMHIVLKEIEKHHGKIYVNSEYGHGAEFVIQLPKSLDLDQQAEAA
ncbi:MAG: sensor histidine kinase [Pseudobdellovibrionaceae bacterium]